MIEINKSLVWDSNLCEATNLLTILNHPCRVGRRSGRSNDEQIEGNACDGAGKRDDFEVFRKIRGVQYKHSRAQSSIPRNNLSHEQ